MFKTLKTSDLIVCLMLPPKHLLAEIVERGLKNKRELNELSRAELSNFLDNAAKDLAAEIDRRMPVPVS